MKVLIISYYFPPVQSVASQRLESFARYLAEFGHDVHVLTRGEDDGHESHPRGYTVYRVKSGFINWLFQKFGFLRKDLPKDAEPAHKASKTTALGRLMASLDRFRIARGLGFLGRMPDFTDTWYLACKRWLRQADEYDWVISSYAPYSSHLAALYARKRGIAVHWVADFRDLWTQHHLFPGLFPFTLLEKRLESRVVGAADMVTTISEPLKARLQMAYPNAKVAVVYNGFDADPDPGSAPDDVAVDGEAIRLVYTGTVYPEHQDMAPLLRALGHWDQHGPRPHFFYAGQSGLMIEKMAASMGSSDHVTDLGNLPAPESLALQRQADVLVYLDVNIPGYDGILPVKLFEYMSTGKPILAITADPGSAACKLLALAGNAQLAPNGTAAITAGLQDALAAGSNSGNPAAPYSRRAQAEVMNRIMEAT